MCLWALIIHPSASRWGKWGEGWVVWYPIRTYTFDWLLVKKFKTASLKIFVLEKNLWEELKDLSCQPSGYSNWINSQITKIKYNKNQIHPSPPPNQGYRMISLIIFVKIFAWQIWCTYTTNATENKVLYSQHIFILHTMMTNYRKDWKK